MNIFELLEKKKQDLEAQSGRRARTEKVPVGRSRWRILPGWRGTEDIEFSTQFGQHFIKGPGSDKPLAVYVCTDVTFGKPCSVCQALESGIMQSTNDAITNALKEGKPSRRILVNALRRDGAEPNKPVILELPPTAFESFVNAAMTHGQDGINVLDLAAGHDVAIEKSGSGMNTKYNVIIVPKSTPIDKGVLANLHNLDEYCRQEYEQGLKKALTAVASVRGVLPPPSHAAGALVGPSAGAGETTRDVTPAVNAGISAQTSAMAAVHGRAPAAAAPVAAPVAATSDEEDLNALFAELEGK